MSLVTTQINLAKQKILESQSIAISSHVDLDGDAIGSVLALESFLKRLGKSVIVLCAHRIPDSYALLNAQWTRARDLETVPDYDVHIIVDCPVIFRIGDAQDKMHKDKPIIVIDHHVSNESFGSINCVDTTVSSSSEIVLRLCESFDQSLTTYEATCLFVGISTDTGSFRHSNTTAESFEAAAKLVRCGIDASTINERLYASLPRRKFELLRRYLPAIMIDEEKRFGWCIVDPELLASVGAQKCDVEGLIDYIRNVEDVDVAAFLFAVEPAKTKVSFRSKGDHDVNRIAEQFGGGGHKKASGCTIDRPAEEALTLIAATVAKG